MKRIETNLISSVLADSEDSSNPVEYLLNEIPERKWKANGTNTATLTITAGAGSNGIGLFWTNASSATVRVYDDTDSSKSLIKTDVIDLTYMFHLFTEYTTQVAEHEIQIDLTSPFGTVVEAGIIYGGLLIALTRKPTSITTSFIDDSIKARWAGGGNYLLKRRVRKIYALSFILKRDTDVRTMEYFLQNIGEANAVWLFFNTLTDSYWAAFGTIDPEAVSVPHTYYEDSAMEITVEEV